MLSKKKCRILEINYKYCYDDNSDDYDQVDDISQYIQKEYNLTNKINLSKDSLINKPRRRKTPTYLFIKNIEINTNLHFQYSKSIEYIYIFPESTKINFKYIKYNKHGEMEYIDILKNNNLKEIRWIDNDDNTHIGIPPNITSIEGNLFQYSKLNPDFILPQNIVELSNYAFKFSYITNVILPNIKIINEGVFMNCKFLVNVELDNVERIENKSFMNCKNLQQIKLPDTLIYIGNNAFTNTKLESIIIPKNVIHLGSYAFSNCKYLKNVTFCNRFPEKVYITCFYDTYITNVDYGYNNYISIKHRNKHYIENKKGKENSCVKNITCQVTSNKIYKYILDHFKYNKGEFIMKNRIVCKLETLCGEKFEFPFSIENYDKYFDLKENENNIINNIDSNFDTVIYKYIQTLNNFKEVLLENLNITLQNITTKQDTIDLDRNINCFNIIVTTKF